MFAFSDGTNKKEKNQLWTNERFFYTITFIICFFQVEQIKRENQLWTNDSLFLREHLLIPVQNEDVSSIPDRYETVVIDPVSRTRSASQKSNTSAKSNESEKNVPKDSSSSSSSSQKAAANGESGMDFLSKYDTSIAQLKSNVNQMEKNAR